MSIVQTPSRHLLTNLSVELEEHKRTLWALYCQTVQASCSYGRPSMLRLADIELDEPAAVDDVYISVDQGIGTQPTDRPSVMAGFVAGVRLHMILERTIRRVNHIFRHPEEVNPAKPSFIDLVSAIAPRKFRVEDELELLPHVTDGLVGDWSFSPSTVSDSDSVRFFQRTRVFTLQQFIRLLSARHRFTQILGAESGSIGTVDEQAVLQQVTQSALGIIGTYSIIDTQGRLDFFGAHAVSRYRTWHVDQSLTSRSPSSCKRVPVSSVSCCTFALQLHPVARMFCR